MVADNSALIWAAAVLGSRYGLAPEQFSGWLGTLVLGTGFGGAVLGGLAADFGQKSGRPGGVLLGAVIAATIGVPAALFPVARSVRCSRRWMGTLVLCGTITGLMTSVALTVLIPNEARGRCIGAFIPVAGMLGFGAAPSAVAWVSA